MMHNISLIDPHIKNKIKIFWATDLHLDAVSTKIHRKFLESIVIKDPEIVLIGGDICNGVKCLSLLKNLARLLKGYCYFVLGNHDYYYGSIEKSRHQAEETFKGW